MSEVGLRILEMLLRVACISGAGLLVFLAARGAAPALRRLILLSTLCAAMTVPAYTFFLMGTFWALGPSPASHPDEEVGSSSFLPDWLLSPVRQEASSPAMAHEASSTKPSLELGVLALPDWFATSFFFLWLGGTLLGGGYLLGKYRELRRINRSLREVFHPGWQRLAARLARTMGIRERVRLRLGEEAASPMIHGTFSPRLTLPGYMKDWPEEKLRLVFLHELAHWKNRDNFVGPVALWMRAFLWCEPLYRKVMDLLRSESEKSCDDLVLRAGVSPVEYATSLFEVLSWSRRKEAPPLGAACLTGGQAKERMTRILNAQAKRWVPGSNLRDSFVLLGVLSAVFLVHVALPLKLEARALGPSQPLLQPPSLACLGLPQASTQNDPGVFTVTLHDRQAEGPSLAAHPVSPGLLLGRSPAPVAHEYPPIIVEKSSALPAAPEASRHAQAVERLELEWRGVLSRLGLEPLPLPPAVPGTEWSAYSAAAREALALALSHERAERPAAALQAYLRAAQFQLQALRPGLPEEMIPRPSAEQLDFTRFRLERLLERM
ncbi:MAG: M56 family metallopeptidase [Verrucomicrobiota bacterium]